MAATVPRNPDTHEAMGNDFSAVDARGHATTYVYDASHMRINLLDQRSRVVYGTAAFCM